MKYCPKCGFETDDEEILYCADDGQLLVEKKQRKTKKTETVISKKESNESKEKNESKESKESINKTTPQEKTTHSEETINDSPETHKSDGKTIILAILLILSIILCFVFNNQAKKAKEKSEDSDDQIWNYYLYSKKIPEIQIVADEFYNADDYGNNIGSRPFYSYSLRYLGCDYSVVTKPNAYFDEDDYLEIKIINANYDSVFDTFYQSFDRDSFYVDTYYYDSDCWYIVQWIYDDEVIYEKTFYIN